MSPYLTTMCKNAYILYVFEHQDLSPLYAKEIKAPLHQLNTEGDIA